MSEETPDGGMVSALRGPGRRFDEVTQDVEVLRPLTRDRPAGPPRRAGGRNGRERLASLPSMNVRAMCSICCYFVSACLCWYSSSMSVLVQQFDVCIWAHFGCRLVWKSFFSFYCGLCMLQVACASVPSLAIPCQAHPNETTVIQDPSSSSLSCTWIEFNLALASNSMRESSCRSWSEGHDCVELASGILCSCRDLAWC